MRRSEPLRAKLPALSPAANGGLGAATSDPGFAGLGGTPDPAHWSGGLAINERRAVGRAFRGRRPTKVSFRTRQLATAARPLCVRGSVTRRVRLARSRTFRRAVIRRGFDPRRE